MTMNDDRSHRSSSGCHIAVGDVATGWGSFTVFGCGMVVGGCGCHGVAVSLLRCWGGMGVGGCGCQLWVSLSGCCG